MKSNQSDPPANPNLPTSEDPAGASAQGLVEKASAARAEVPETGALRGRMYRHQRQMPDEEAREFLRRQKIAHVGVIDPQGWPYVVPLVFVYEGGEQLYLHTGSHPGHFASSVLRNPRLCVEVAEIGPLHPGKPYACNSALVYTSVIVFGPVRILEDRKKKEWFFDRLLEKYGQAEWSFEPGYPHIHRILLYEQQIEILTGKRSFGLYH